MSEQRMNEGEVQNMLREMERYTNTGECTPLLGNLMRGCIEMITTLLSERR